jgi:AcrR family transcriptional regulator
VDTRRAILNAALVEFAEKGFDAASIRVIADRTGLQHPLITYHFRSKDTLWRATAEYAFGQIREEWDGLDESNAGMSPLDRLRAEYRTVFKYTVAFPEFHRFMRQECSTNNPRLKWVAKTVVLPLIGRLLPQIAALQEAGRLPHMEPIVFHYMMVGLTATLSEFGPEMGVTGKLAADDPRVVKSYWRAVEKMVFDKSSSDSDIDALTFRLPSPSRL